MKRQDDRAAPPRDVVEMGHEPAELRARGFVIFLICLVIGAAAINALLAWAYLQMKKTREHQAVSSPLAESHPLPPGPVQEGSAAHPQLPAEDLAALKTRDEMILGNYAWVDKDKGIVRVPIERGMEMLLQRGLPVRAQTPGSASGNEGKGGER